MPFGRRVKDLPVPEDAHDWRPQAPGTGGFRSVAAPIIEPFWDGVEVLAHLDGGEVRLIDGDGLDLAEAYPELAAALVESARATGTGSLVAHAVLTTQAMDDEPSDKLLIEQPSAQQVARRMFIGGLGEKKRLPPVPFDPEKPAALVLVDLLMVDGEALLDVPLLERKRLLDGTVQRQGGIKVTPFVQPPGDNFRVSCRVHGFWAVIYKGANGRYRPGRASRDWAVLRLPTR